MQRSLVWVLVLLLVSVFCASCQQKPPLAVTIEVWDGPRPDMGENKFAWMESVISQFEKANPGVRVVLTKMPWQEMVNRLDQQLVSGNFPDIVPLHAGGGGIRLEHLDRGLIESADDFFGDADLQDLYPAARQAFTFGGKMYGFPMRTSLHVLLLNLEIFRERGVAPPVNGNWTYEEFLDKAKKLTFVRQKDKAQQVYGFAAYINKGYYELWPFLYMDGARPLSRDTAVFTLDSRQGLSALTKLVELKYKHKVALPETGSSDHSLIWRAFASPHERRVAIEPWPDWAIMLTQQDPRFKTDIMVARYPTGQDKKPVTIGSVYGFSVLSQPDRQKRRLVMELARTLSNPSQQEHFARTFGLLPARRSVAERVSFPHPELKRAAAFIEDIDLLPKHPKWVQIENTINAEVQTALIGEKTPEHALKDARREVEALISLPR